MINTPGYSRVMARNRHIASPIEPLRASLLWAHTVIIVTYADYRGFWDDVAPPRGDRWGPGVRVPAIIISPFAKHGAADHTAYHTTSIIEFIASFGLEPLPGVRRGMGDLTGALDLPANHTR